MSLPDDKNINVNHELTTVALTRLGTVRTIEVLETDLDQVGDSVAGESTALGFLTFAAGSGLGAFLQWMSIETRPPALKGD